MYQSNWTQGYGQTGGTQSKQSDHLQITTPPDPELTWVSTGTVDLTNVSAIQIDWANAASGTADAALVVSSSRTADANVYDGRLLKSGSFGRTTDYLDVSGLSGPYYIRIHQMVTGSAATLKVYRVSLLSGGDTVNYWNGNTLVAVGTNGKLQYVNQDSLGSTTLLTNASGTLDTSQLYMPFGQLSATDTVDLAEQFTGQRLDSLSQLYYYNARYYDPTIGRFISPDSMVPDTTNPQAWNRYSYVVNNPLRYTDPTGQCYKWAKSACHFFRQASQDLNQLARRAIDTTVNQSERASMQDQQAWNVENNSTFGSNYATPNPQPAPQPVQPAPSKPNPQLDQVEHKNQPGPQTAVQGNTPQSQSQVPGIPAAGDELGQGFAAVANWLGQSPNQVRAAGIGFLVVAGALTASEIIVIGPACGATLGACIVAAGAEADTLTLIGKMAYSGYKMVKTGELEDNPLAP